MPRAKFLFKSKMLEMWLRCVLIIFGIFPNIVGAFIGITIGLDISINMRPSASEIVATLKEHKIFHVRLYKADPDILRALSNSGIDVMVGVTNDEVLEILKKPSSATTWINKNIAPYLPKTNITTIAVGNEFSISNVDSQGDLAMAMAILYKALNNSNIKISTAQSFFEIISYSGPSQSKFLSSRETSLRSIFEVLERIDSFFMLNMYPYSSCSLSTSTRCPINYELFQPKSPIVDPDSNVAYSSMFEDMLDTAYLLMADFNFSGIPIVVSETGWPFAGDTKEKDPEATVENAETYNNNLIHRISTGLGPPSTRTMPISAYIFEMYSEDFVEGGASWGLFDKDFKGKALYPVNWKYPLFKDEPSPFGAFCVVKENADSGRLQNEMNKICSSGEANCNATQPDHPCYVPDTLQNHASYAFNDHYHKFNRVAGGCYFHGLGMMTDVDPSYGSCIFTGSNATIPPTPAPVPPPPAPILVPNLPSPPSGRAPHSSTSSSLGPILIGIFSLILLVFT